MVKGRDKLRRALQVADAIFSGKSPREAMAAAGYRNAHFTIDGRRVEPHHHPKVAKRLAELEYERGRALWKERGSPESEQPVAPTAGEILTFEERIAVPHARDAVRDKAYLVNRQWRLHDLALEKGDLATARAVLMDIAKIEGYVFDRRVNVNASMKIENLTLEDKQALLNSVQARLGRHYREQALITEGASDADARK